MDLTQKLAKRNSLFQQIHVDESNISRYSMTRRMSKRQGIWTWRRRRLGILAMMSEMLFTIRQFSLLDKKILQHSPICWVPAGMHLQLSPDALASSLLEYPMNAYRTHMRMGWSQ
jgi:hypothetical protein